MTMAATPKPMNINPDQKSSWLLIFTFSLHGVLRSSLSGFPSMPRPDAECDGVEARRARLPAQLRTRAISTPAQRRAWQTADLGYSSRLWLRIAREALAPGRGMLKAHGCGHGPAIRIASGPLGIRTTPFFKRDSP